ncbi:hypothetical protein NM208_g4916 [Fusarium decemcellulare]|uniref:Uncharacterized protein n=2 Tax=Fusarium decemcellulare TaxID=57161 RepID=A0ACC1S262_9HYPO|nr:hypothetical protein NM208_g9316 [Fusarium decemcellulare]KAJ3540773.1 hypothetical protein NM208_g4916 [Fusarium decemcellulare]
MKFSVAAAVAAIPAAITAPAQADSSSALENRQTATTSIKITLHAHGMQYPHEELVPVDGHWHGLSENLNEWWWHEMDVDVGVPENPPEIQTIKCANRFWENDQPNASTGTPVNMNVSFDEIHIHGLCCYYEGETGRSGRGTCDQE